MTHRHLFWYHFVFEAFAEDDMPYSSGSVSTKGTVGSARRQNRNFLIRSFFNCLSCSQQIDSKFDLPGDSTGIDGD